MIELSIILPAYNEAKEILNSVSAVEAKLRGSNVDYELILVNDGSQDDTLAKMESCTSERVKIVSYAKNRGKGYAVRCGMRQALGRFRLFMDVDLSTSLEAVDEFLHKMRSGNYDMLIGERKTFWSQQAIQQPWHRRFLGRGFILLSCLCIGRTFKDFTCGFKMFNQKAAELIFNCQQIDNWAFDTELIYIACVHNLRLGEVPVKWKHHAGSHVRPARDIASSLAGLVKIRWFACFGRYQS